uniref:Uncharacterized protein n=1 Tax=Timema genevievae TaxID=629358 RepID=A0A7R9PHM7_TIMGE|nr:unnamed protein product [Timema genevievae]
MPIMYEEDIVLKKKCQNLHRGRVENHLGKIAPNTIVEIIQDVVAGLVAERSLSQLKIDTTKSYPAKFQTRNTSITISQTRESSYDNIGTIYNNHKYLYTKLTSFSSFITKNSIAKHISSHSRRAISSHYVPVLKWFNVMKEIMDKGTLKRNTVSTLKPPITPVKIINKSCS